MSRVLPDPAAAVPVRDEAQAHSYISGVCFKHGPPRLVGIELEWFLIDPHDPSRTPTAELLRSALGVHTPRTLDPDSPALALPAGAAVTVEPGGQVELSALPAPGPDALVAAVATDVAALDSLLAPVGLARAVRPPATPRARVLSTPRYDAMERAFDAVGPWGRRMMCGSAATQLSLDVGTAEQAGDRWALAHALGPVLLAALASSSAPGGPVSTRMDSWWRLDPVRTAAPTDLDPAAWSERVLSTPVLAVRSGGGGWTVDNRRTPRQWLASGAPMTTADLDVHLSTLFPPVRPQGYLELRWLDAQTDEDWPLVVHLLCALFADPGATGAALAALAPAAGRWAEATRVGLADPVLRRAARALYDVLDPALPAGAPTTAAARALAHRRLVEGITPARDLHTDTHVEAAS